MSVLLIAAIVFGTITAADLGNRRDGGGVRGDSEQRRKVGYVQSAVRGEAPIAARQPRPLTGDYSAAPATLVSAGWPVHVASGRLAGVDRAAALKVLITGHHSTTRSSKRSRTYVLVDEEF